MTGSSRSVDELAVGKLTAFRDRRGVLFPLEVAQIAPFVPARLFWITEAPAGTVRGAHAHKRCHQLMICCQGEIRLDAYDGAARRTLELEAGDYVHVPPLIFSSEEFAGPQTLLLVVCDRPYEADDYLTSEDALRQYLQHEEH